MKTQILLILGILVIVLVSGCSQTGQLTSNNNLAQSLDNKADIKPSVGTKDGAERTAVQFSVLMSKQQYTDVYYLLVPQIQNLYTSVDFSDIMNDKFKDINLIYDKVVLISDNEAYAYYKFQSGLIETSMDPVKLEFYNGEWRINAFAGLDTDIQQKKENNAKMVGYKYFYNLGEVAKNEKISIKINDVKIVDKLTDKYGHIEKPDNGYSFLIIDATIKNLDENPLELLAEPRFGSFIYKYDESNIFGNDYISADMYHEYPTISIEGSFDSMWKYSLRQNEVASGFIAYEVPSQLTNFVIPYKSFYWDYNKKDFLDIYFIVKITKNT